MKFADLETSKKLYELLQELGVVPESEFGWIHYEGLDIKFDYLSIHYISNRNEGFCKICPAYSFDEVWDMLPKLTLRSILKNWVDLKGLWWALNYLLSIDNITQSAHELLIFCIEKHKDEVKKHLEGLKDELP